MHCDERQPGAGADRGGFLQFVWAAAGVFLAGALAAQAGRYVVMPGTPGGTNAGAFDDWTIAATQIQWAVDAAGVGETVWVSNGVYVLTNQIVITNAVTLRSAEGHGPADTIIDGGFTGMGVEGETTNRRCLWMSNAAALVHGFTFSNGASLLNTVDTSGSGAGVWMYSGVLSNCDVCNNALFSPTFSQGGGGGIYCGAIGSIGATVTACRVFGNLLTNLNFNQANSRGTGVGINILDANSLVSNCLVSNNFFAGQSGSENHGAGIYAYYPCRIRSSLICHNRNPNSHAGGIRMQYSPSIHDSTVTLNQAYSGGGCSIVNGGTLSNCVVSYNLSAYTWFAGGIHVQDVNVAYKCRIYDTLVVGNTNMGVCFSKGNSNPADSGPGPKQMVNCIVRDNTRHGLWLGGTNNWISNCVVSGNGGVGVYGYNGYLRNCLISGNASNGVLIHANCQTALVSACTIVDNLAANEGAGVRVEATAPGLVQFSSCIVAGNGASGTNDVYDASGNNAGALQYSCAGDLDGFSGVSNRVDDPQFKDAAGGDYRLRSSSPCINAGTNEPWMDTAADLAGGPRILHGTVDMGAYETLLIRGGIISIR